MRDLHTMVRVSDEKARWTLLQQIGAGRTCRYDSEAGRFTNILAAPGDADTAADTKALVEPTYNWDPEDYTGGRTSAIWPLRPMIATPFVRAPGWRRDHQPAAARRPHGLCPFARWHPVER